MCEHWKTYNVNCFFNLVEKFSKFHQTGKYIYKNKAETNQITKRKLYVLFTIWVFLHW